MSPLTMGRKQVKAVSAEELTSRSGALEQALDAGGSELDPTAVASARALVDKIGERISKAGNHTVVALAGATGSGKSSLFNALVGSEVAVVGARRPTTSRPVAGCSPSGDTSGPVWRPEMENANARRPGVTMRIWMSLRRPVITPCSMRARATRTSSPVGSPFTWTGSV